MLQVGGEQALLQAPPAAQLSAYRLAAPSGVGPSATTEPPPPMFRPPQVRFLMRALLPVRVSPQVPPEAPKVKSRNAPPTDAVVEVVVELVLVVLEVLVVELVLVVLEVLVVELVLVVEDVLVVGEGLVVELVLVVLVVLVVVEVLVVLDVEVVVVVVVADGLQTGPSPAHVFAIQSQAAILHWSSTQVLQALRAIPDKPAHATLTSSEQFFELHAGGAALAPETKMPA